MEPLNQSRADIRQSWMDELDNDDLASWQTVSVFGYLRALLAGDCPPASSKSSRVAMVKRLIGELDRRGFDGESIVRYGMATDLAAPIFITFIGAKLLGDDEIGNWFFEQESLEFDPGLAEKWKSILNIPFGLPASMNDEDLVSSDHLEVAERLRKALSGSAGEFVPVYAWTMAADIDDLIALRPPSADQMRVMMANFHSPDLDTLLDYVWIVDRFSLTYLHSWITNSLLAEYRWLNGLRLPPCLPELMPHRNDITHEDLNAEIARRAARKGLEEAGQEVGTRWTLKRHVRQRANAYLEEGRFREAAALFEFMYHEDESDVDALNNMAFCRIPDDPESALRSLEKADHEGYEPKLINAYNRICCQLALGRMKSALALLEALQAEDLPDAQGVIWAKPKGTSGPWALRDVTSVRGEIETLARQYDLQYGQSSPVQPVGFAQ